MKTTTLKHVTEDGVQAKRQSARPYTHVVVRKSDPQAHAAAVEARRASTVAEGVERRRAWHQEKLATVAVGLGGKVGWRTVTELALGLAQEWLAEHPSLEASLEEARKEYDEGVDRDKARALQAFDKWRVVSWHQSAALADKAAGAYDVPGDRSKVEAVNGGVRV